MKNKFLINKLFFLIFFFFKISTVDSFSANEVSIVVKVNNEIITNLDIQNEYRYLIALNNKLASIDKDEIMVLAKNSIVREKIKKKELEKYYDLNQENEHIDEIIQNFYVKLGINNETDFKNYLSSYDLTLDQIKKKIKN